MQAARCAAWAGSNVPPNKPMRMPGAYGGSTMRDSARERAAGEALIMSAGKSPLPTHPALAAIAVMRDGKAKRSRPRLSVAADAVLETGQLFDADRAARMQPAGGDADLGAETELTAIGELGRGVVEYDR